MRKEIKIMDIKIQKHFKDIGKLIQDLNKEVIEFETYINELEIEVE